MDVPQSAPAASGVRPETKFPYDAPGTTYGNVLPFAKDESTGDIHLAFPELIRAPYRGVLEGGQRLLGNRPQEYGKAATPDETAAVMALAPGLAGGTIDRVAKGPAAELANSLSAPETRAVGRIASRMATDLSAGGKHPSEIYDEMVAGRAAGKPVVLSDVSGKNVDKLAGSVARAPGAASEYADLATRQRLAGAGERLTRDVDKYIASGPTMRQTVEQLRADQRAAAAPLYEEALKPGSVAPLERQFEDALNEASKAEKDAAGAVAEAHQQATLAAAEKLRAGDNVYAANRALRSERNAQFEMQAAQRQLAEATAAKQAVLGRLREAQAAETNGDRGGIWSPYIQRLLGNQNVQTGIKRGLEIQRNEADALNRPFNPTDYAVDNEGNVVRTPNMRLLDAAKKGLDAILEDYRDPLTGKLNLDERGRSIEMLRKSLVTELDRVNPSYAAARAAWAGPAQQIGATKAGAKAIGWHPEDITKYYAGLSPSERPFFKMGVAQALKDAIAKKSVTAPEIRAIGRNSYDSMMKQRLRPIFDSDEQFNRFLDAVTTERTMLEQAGRRVSGSQTAERIGDDADQNLQAASSAARLGRGVASLNPVEAAHGVAGLAQNYIARLQPETNMAMAKLLFDPNVDFTQGPGLALLLKLQKELGMPGAPSPQAVAKQLGVQP
jgi:hypothetical protein